MSETKRGRQPIQVKPNELQECINLLESVQPEGKFQSRSALWDALCDTLWARSRLPVSLKPQTAMVLAKKFNLTIQTPVGKKGRPKGCGPVPNGGNRRKPMSAEVESAMRKSFPLNIIKIIPKVLDKAASGSLRAAVKLKCLDCTNMQPVEIRLCELNGCPLWHFRPYKK